MKIVSHCSVHLTTSELIAYVAGVRRGRKEERRAREAREDRTREDRGRASPSRAHFDFSPFLRPATQASELIVSVLPLGVFAIPVFHIVSSHQLAFAFTPPRRNLKMAVSL